MLLPPSTDVSIWVLVPVAPILAGWNVAREFVPGIVRRASALGMDETLPHFALGKRANLLAPT